MSWSDPNQGQHLSINSIIKHIQHTHTYTTYIYIYRHMYMYYVVHALVMLHYVIWLSIVNFRLYIVLDYDHFREVFRDAFYTVSEAAVAEKPMLCVCVWFLFMFCIVEFQQNLVKPHHFQSQKAFVHQAGNEGQIEKSRRSGSLA